MAHRPCSATTFIAAPINAHAGAALLNTLHPPLSEASLRYLDGSLPGDYGFDPLGFFDPANSAGMMNQPWLRYDGRSTGWDGPIMPKALLAKPSGVLHALYIRHSKAWVVIRPSLYPRLHDRDPTVWRFFDTLC